MIVIILIIFEPVNYMYKYFILNRDYAASEMDKNLVSILETTQKNRRPHEILYISGSVFCPNRIDSNFKPFAYVSILFFLRIPPEQYLAGKIPVKLLERIPDKKLHDGLLLTSNKVTVYQNDQV